MINEYFLEDLHYAIIFRDYENVCKKLIEIGKYYGKVYRVNIDDRNDVIQEYVMSYERICRNYDECVPFFGRLRNYLKRCYRNTLINYVNHIDNTGLNRLINESGRVL